MRDDRTTALFPTTRVLLIVKSIFLLLVLRRDNVVDTLQIASVPYLRNHHKFTVSSARRRYPRTSNKLWTKSGSDRSSSDSGRIIADGDDNDDDAQQWYLFKKHHAKGLWRGNWTTYDNGGNVIDSRQAIVALEPARNDDDDDVETIHHRHEIEIIAPSDTTRRFQNIGANEFKSIPVTSYREGDLKNNRCVSRSMACGPALLRSGGGMSIELVLADGDERLRVVLRFVAFWSEEEVPGGGGGEDRRRRPDGLELHRAVVSRESLRADGNAVTGSVPESSSLLWRAKWAGTTSLWRSDGSRDCEWVIDNLHEEDAWHCDSDDDRDVWILRLEGGVVVRCPRVLVGGGAVGICRLAWLRGVPSERLLRAEAEVVALEEVEGDDVGFLPPALKSLRCDDFEEVGELERGVGLEMKEDVEFMEDEEKGDDDVNGFDAIRNALKL